MPTIKETLLSRFKGDGVPALDPAKIALTRIFAFHDDISAHHIKISGSQNLTPVGRQDAMRKYVTEHAHELHRARKSVETMRAKLSERRAKLQPLPPDPKDLSAAILRSEMRTMLRGMNSGQRMSLVLSANTNQTLVHAVLEAPNFASGVNDQARELLTVAAVEKAHPGALAEIERIEEAIEVVNAAVRIAFDKARAAAEFRDERVLTDFVEKAVGDSRALDADVDRSFTALADISAHV